MRGCGDLSCNTRDSHLCGSQLVIAEERLHDCAAAHVREPVDWSCESAVHAATLSAGGPKAQWQSVCDRLTRCSARAQDVLVQHPDWKAQLREFVARQPPGMVPSHVRQLLE